MSLDIKIVQTATEQKPLPLKVILGADFLYGAYDESWRLHIGKRNQEDFVAYMPMNLARGIAVQWSEERTDAVEIRGLTPTSQSELRALFEMVDRICTYWECQLFVDGNSMELEDFLDDYERISAYNMRAVYDLSKSIMNGENTEITLFSVMWPLVVGRNEADAFLLDPSYFPKWLHNQQNIDAHFIKPAFYRGENRIIGRYAVAEEMNCIMPVKPYVPYGFDDPQTGELLQCDDFGVLLYNVTDDENIGEMTYDDFISALKERFSSKVKRYDGNHFILEEMSLSELKEILK